MADNILGAPIPHTQDPVMLSGEATYIADMHLPGMLHMAILRSEHGHALIKSIDTSAAQLMPGVVRVITAADVEGKLMPLPCVWVPGGVDSHFPPHPFGFIPGAGSVLATDRVRYIGDPVAAVIAETRAQAHDALDAIRVDYEPLPVVVDAEEAVKDGAPLLHDAVPHNLNALWTVGDKEKTEQVIANAEVVINLPIRNQRTINSPLEPRGALGSYDPATGEYTLRASSQSPHNHAFLLAFLVLGIPLNKLRVVSAPFIGGSFGTKGYLYADMALVLFLAKELGRPIKWVDTRTGMMQSTVQGRDHKQVGTLAGTKDGKITALRCISYANLGAYPSTIGPGVATAMMGRSIASVYAIDNAYCEVFAAFTNTVPLGAQRGSGRAEATFMVERLIDLYAAEIGMDRAEVRRKNLVTPDQIPYDNHLGWLYDSGDYPATLERVLQMANYDTLQARKAEARQRGKRLGLGICPFVTVSGVGPSPRMAKEGMLGGTWESANVRVYPTGEVVATIGSTTTGQGHETTFAQIVAQELQIDVSQIQIVHSDTKHTNYGQGTYGSRSFSVGGPALLLAARAVKDKIRKVAAYILEASEDDILYQDGRAFVKGTTPTPQNSRTFQEMALTIWYGWTLPPGMEPNLDATVNFDPPDFNYPFGAHVAEIEIDEATGQPELVRYFAVNDAGVVGNAKIIEGLFQGSITHGLGQALMEHAVYDDQGQLLTHNFATYTIPKASDVLNYTIERTVTPTPHNPLGAKGAGELGTDAATSSFGNAVHDALADLGIKHIDMPFTAEKIWRAMREARQENVAD